MNRRALLSIVLAVITLPANAGVETTVRGRRVPAFGIPRGTVVETLPIGSVYSSASEIFSVPMISTGADLVMLESDEGQLILAERAANTRPDGSIRHRQHHPTCFPSCR